MTHNAREERSNENITRPWVTNERPALGWADQSEAWSLPHFAPGRPVAIRVFMPFILFIPALMDHVPMRGDCAVIRLPRTTNLSLYLDAVWNHSSESFWWRSTMMPHSWVSPAQGSPGQLQINILWGEVCKYESRVNWILDVVYLATS